MSVIDTRLLAQQPQLKKRRLLEDAVCGIGEIANPVILQFADSCQPGQEDLLLLELPEELLAEVMTDSALSGVHFAGSDGGDVVLTTSSQTFKLTRAETSNALLLIEPETGDDNQAAPRFTISASVGHQCEVAKMTPNVDALKAALYARPYRGDDSAGAREDGEQDLTLGGLQEVAHASRKELLSALQALGALEISGEWRVLEASFLEKILDGVLDYVVAEDMPLEKVEIDAMATQLAAVAGRPVLEHCLRLYSHPCCVAGAKTAGPTLASKTAGAAVAGTCSLDLDAIAQYRAHQLLRRRAAAAKDHAEALWPVEDFASSWAASVPGVIPPDEKLLQGIAIKKQVELLGLCWAYLPERDLSTDPRERLAALMNVKLRWPQAELEPYLRPLATPNTSVTSMLLKHGRQITDTSSGEKFYTLRQ